LGNQRLFNRLISLNQPIRLNQPVGSRFLL
jgi:hypothetical protein